MAELIVTQEPAPGRGRLLYAGEVLRVRIEARLAGGDPAPLPDSARAFVRTDLNSAPEKRRHAIDRVERQMPRIVTGWHDVELSRAGPSAFEVDLIVFRPGYYELKSFVAVGGHEHWVPGPNAHVSVHPLKWRGGNVIYTAFPRQFGPTKTLEHSRELLEDPRADELERRGFTVIPPSGTLADLAKELPFLFRTLGIRILHLLPIQETPTVYGRMGRYGSPYAATDLRSVGHAYCELRTDRTPAEQFAELCARVHALGGEVMLDLAANHLGWATELLNEHPEWFVRRPDGHFVSPGAWGVTWEDLVELDDRRHDVWRHLADTLLTWCERGIDAFRCDAGYMLPTGLWEYVTARVHEVFPNTLFLLEGLGGPWEATESILKSGGMQWAYSEIFQQEGLEMLLGYIRHLDRTGCELGILANYAETHDNPRLAARGADYARMRVALAALTSQGGAFGFSNGVEWLAEEKIDVHGSSALRWGRTPNLVGWIGTLSELVRRHPAFWGAARLIPVSDAASGILAFVRQRDGERLLILVNPGDRIWRDHIRFPAEMTIPAGHRTCIVTRRMLDPAATFSLNPFEVVCLDLERAAPAESGDALDYSVRASEEERRLRWILGELWGERIDLDGFGALLETVRREGLRGLLAAISLGLPADCGELARRVASVSRADRFLGVSEWNSTRTDRLHVFAANQFLYIEEEVPFRVRLAFAADSAELETFRDFGDHRWVAFALAPEGAFAIEQSRLDRSAEGSEPGGEPRWIGSHGPALCLAQGPAPVSLRFERDAIEPSHRFLLTNERGSYTLLPLAPRTVWSKYDALLAANLHASAPQERVVVLKRVRAWLSTPMVSYPLDREYLVDFQRWPVPTWRYSFALPEGSIHVEERVTLASGGNAVRVELRWESEHPSDAALVVRPDVELRGHHGETKAYALDQGAFTSAHRTRADGNGFERRLGERLELTVSLEGGRYQAEPEWTYNVPHAHEATRGQEAMGDAFSPGYFRVELPMGRGSAALTAVVGDPLDAAAAASAFPAPMRDSWPEDLGEIARHAASQFWVQRDGHRSIIAGYPWFLDWGRDALIAARGYLAIGQVDEVCDLVVNFARFERDGTLPNSLSGRDDSNRDTSDAPLWLIRTLEELSHALGWDALAARAALAGVELKQVMASICDGYLRGTPNGIRCDRDSGLVWSPAHFTWMDTSYPAATPREGYPVDIQAHWVRALGFASRILKRPEYAEVAARAQASLEQRFWIEDLGWFADCLAAPAGVAAAHAVRDESLRPNQLHLVTAGLAKPEQAQRVVVATERELLVPCALRSVAKLPLRAWPWIPGRAAPAGFDPMKPYRGRYEGDEDSSRKLAYHNGTAWAHLLPLWTEAMLLAFPDDSRATGIARAALRTAEAELRRGCVGQISEVFDGDYPHTPRGACAQAWAVTELLRVLAKLP